MYTLNIIQGVLFIWSEVKVINNTNLRVWTRDLVSLDWSFINLVICRWAKMLMKNQSWGNEYTQSIQKVIFFISYIIQSEYYETFLITCQSLRGIKRDSWTAGWVLFVWYWSSVLSKKSLYFQCFYFTLCYQ